jgi:hypothetical protein
MGARGGPAQAAAERVLDWHTLWSLDTCYDMLFFCRSHLTSAGAAAAPMVARLTAVGDRLRLYEAVMRAHGRWRMWQDVAAACTAAPAEVVNNLLAETEGQWDLARRLTLELNLDASLLKVCARPPRSSCLSDAGARVGRADRTLKLATSPCCLSAAILSGPFSGSRR